MFGTRLKNLLTKRGMTQFELAEKAGINNSTISSYVTGLRKPTIGSLLKICEALEVDLNYFSDIPDDMRSSDAEEVIWLPVIGVVPAGIPIEAIEDHAGQVPVAVSSIQGKGRVFCLRVMGESMQPTLYEGDTVVIAPDLAPADGEIVVARFGLDAEVLIKRFHLVDGLMVLKSDNPVYAPIICRGKCKLIGRVILMQRKM